MSIYVTYWDGSGRDDYREVAKCFLAANDAVQFGNATDGQTTLTGAVKSHTGGATDTVGPGWFVDVSRVGQAPGAKYGRVYADLPLLTAAAERNKRWKAELHDAWRNFNDVVFQSWWAGVAGSSDASVATYKWAYLQIAMGRRVVDQTIGTSMTIARRQAVIDKIKLWVGSPNAEIWYGVMVANSGPRQNWKMAGTDSHDQLYSDLVTLSTMADRGVDGTYGSPTSSVGAGFNPDLPTLGGVST